MFFVMLSIISRQILRGAKKIVRKNTLTDFFFALEAQMII